MSSLAILQHNVHTKSNLRVNIILTFDLLSYEIPLKALFTKTQLISFFKTLEISCKKFFSFQIPWLWSVTVIGFVTELLHGVFQINHVISILATHTHVYLVQSKHF
jgi:hypothetical protein